MEIGNKIKDARNGAGLTQDQAAEKIMVSRQTISNWENGKTMPDIASVIKMSDLYHISLDELLKGDQDMMKKIEKDTNIVRSNSRLIAVGIVAIIVAVVVTFASIMTGNALLNFLAASLSWVFMGVALACFLATRKPDEKTPMLRVAGFIPIMIGVMFMIGGIYLMNACMWRGIGIGMLVVGIVLNGVGLAILFYRKNRHGK